MKSRLIIIIFLIGSPVLLNAAGTRALQGAGRRAASVLSALRSQGARTARVGRNFNGQVARKIKSQGSRLGNVVSDVSALRGNVGQIEGRVSGMGRNVDSLVSRLGQAEGRELLNQVQTNALRKTVEIMGKEIELLKSQKVSVHLTAFLNNSKKFLSETALPELKRLFQYMKSMPSKVPGLVSDIKSGMPGFASDVKAGILKDLKNMQQYVNQQKIMLRGLRDPQARLEALSKIELYIKEQFNLIKNESNAAIESIIARSKGYGDEGVTASLLLMGVLAGTVLDSDGSEDQLDGIQSFADRFSGAFSHEVDVDPVALEQVRHLRSAYGSGHLQRQLDRNILRDEILSEAWKNSPVLESDVYVDGPLPIKEVVEMDPYDRDYDVLESDASIVGELPINENSESYWDYVYGLPGNMYGATKRGLGWMFGR